MTQRRSTIHAQVVMEPKTVLVSINQTQVRDGYTARPFAPSLTMQTHELRAVLVVCLDVTWLVSDEHALTLGYRYQIPSNLLAVRVCMRIVHVHGSDTGCMVLDVRA